MLKTFKKKFYVGIGSIFLFLGIVGIFIPVLPTTPFLILTTICYMNGSKRLYNWIIQNRLLGGFIKNYIEGNGISIKSKIVSISFLWMTISLSFFFIDYLLIQLILMIVLIGVTVHIALIRTNRRRNYHGIKSTSK